MVSALPLSTDYAITQRGFAASKVSRSTKPHEPTRRETNDKTFVGFANGSCDFVDRFSRTKTRAPFVAQIYRKEK
jgi:hypothetical protein